MVFIASSLLAGWPACLSLAGLSLCPLCIIINLVFHSSIGVGDDGDHDGSPPLTLVPAGAIEIGQVACLVEDAAAGLSTWSLNLCGFQNSRHGEKIHACLLYTSDAADE